MMDIFFPFYQMSEQHSLFLFAVNCIVEFDYEATQADELTLKKGDIIHNVKKMPGGWWEGTINGRVGVFPDNFVKVSLRHWLQITKCKCCQSF